MPGVAGPGHAVEADAVGDGDFHPARVAPHLKSDDNGAGVLANVARRFAHDSDQRPLDCRRGIHATDRMPAGTKGRLGPPAGLYSGTGDGADASGQSPQGERTMSLSRLEHREEPRMVLSVGQITNPVLGAAVPHTCIGGSTRPGRHA